jgi:hypothetical protein
LRRRGGRRAWAAESGGRRRGSGCSGEQASRPGQRAGGQAQEVRGKGLDVLSRHWSVAGHRAHRGSAHGGAAAGSGSREARGRKAFIAEHEAVGGSTSLRAKVARSQHGAPARAACAAKYGDVASGRTERRGRTRGAQTVGKIRRWSAAQPSCVRRVAPVGPRHPCRAHDVGPRWQRTAWRVGVARLGRERRAPTKHFE